ncbi:hypothetical protein [Burkholderia gladioli]|uniref:hypothetical protein n=1 Tax=Burkholderia gladioli TaxID=28095 RepID=UPI0023643555|nr:hypothetical protein [Burkholderia gladioli]MDD1789067.1 hypothetical protein [Burkholderia gladioli]
MFDSDDDEDQELDAAIVQSLSSMHLLFALIKVSNLSPTQKGEMLQLFRSMQQVPQQMARNGELPQSFLPLLDDFDRNVADLLLPQSFSGLLDS